jgi:hypothetical protein
MQRTDDARAFDKSIRKRPQTVGTKRLGRIDTTSARPENGDTNVGYKKIAAFA